MLVRVYCIFEWRDGNELELVLVYGYETDPRGPCSIETHKSSLTIWQMRRALYIFVTRACVAPFDFILNLSARLEPFLFNFPWRPL